MSDVDLKKVVEYVGGERYQMIASHAKQAKAHESKMNYHANWERG